MLFMTGVGTRRFTRYVVTESATVLSNRSGRSVWWWKLGKMGRLKTGFMTGKTKTRAWLPFP